MTDNAPKAAATDARKDAVLAAVAKGCPRWIAAAAGDMTRDDLRQVLEDDEDFARRMEIARGKAGEEAITALWDAPDKDLKVWTWLLENLILPRRSAAGAKAQGRRGQGDGEEGENRVGLGTQRLIEALERLGIQPPASTVGSPADGPLCGNG